MGPNKSLVEVSPPGRHLSVCDLADTVLRDGEAHEKEKRSVQRIFQPVAPLSVE